MGLLHYETAVIIDGIFCFIFVAQCAFLFLGGASIVGEGVFGDLVRVGIPIATYHDPAFCAFGLFTAIWVTNYAFYAVLVGMGPEVATAKELGVGSVLCHWLGIVLVWYTSQSFAEIFETYWYVTAVLVTFFGLWQTFTFVCGSESAFKASILTHGIVWILFMVLLCFLFFGGSDKLGDGIVADFPRMGIPAGSFSDPQFRGLSIFMFGLMTGGCIYEIKVGIMGSATKSTATVGVGSVIGHWLAIPAAWYASTLWAKVYGPLWLVVCVAVSMFGVWQTITFFGMHPVTARESGQESQDGTYAILE